MDKHISEARVQRSNAFRWVEAYRNHAHRTASVDPVKFRASDESVAERTLDYTRYGLTVNDRINPFGLVNTGASSTITTEQLQDLLQTMYCGTTSIELAFIEDEHEREWLAEQYERSFQTTLASIDKREIAQLLLQSQAFDNFVATKFPTVKRYGGEGAESIMAFYRQLFRCAAEADLTNIVVGMPHRGKLNVLTTLFQTRPAKIFRKFKGLPEFPEGVKAMCDIASHFRE